MKYNISKNQDGFTLIELIVSLSIVAIIIALGLGGIRLGITARGAGERKVDSYQRIRIITEQLTQKLQSTYPVFVTHKDGVPLVKGPASNQRIMAFEGESNSLRFVTFASPITATNQNSLIHEVKFYIGKHPETEKRGLILMEKEISGGDIFSRINNGAENTQYFLLSENVGQIKFRYYQIKKLEPNETKKFNNRFTYSGNWVNKVVMTPSEANQETPIDPLLETEKENKISLPRAVEITLGLTEKIIENKEGSLQETPKTIFAPPIIVLLNSGMEIALPEKKGEIDENA